MEPAFARKALTSMFLLAACAGACVSAEDAEKEKELTLEITLMQKKVLKSEQSGSLIHPTTYWKGRLTFKVDRVVSGAYKKSECKLDVSESSIVINSQWRGANFWQRTGPTKSLRIHFFDRKPDARKIACIEELKIVDGKETWQTVSKYEEPFLKNPPIDPAWLKLDLPK